MLTIPTVILLGQPIQFEKIVIDTTYVSSAVTTADIDRDGLDDIIAGDVWYQAPDWQRRDIRPLGHYYGTLVDSTKPIGSGASYYARCIGTYAQDLDGDGWQDVITFNSQGASCFWYRNPQGQYDRPWQEYRAIEIFHNESPQVVDLFGDGDPVVLAGHLIGNRRYTLSWFTPREDPTQLWEAHTIGHPDSFHYTATYRYTDHFAPGGRGHGLGIGDVNGDAWPDVLTPQGWYEGPPGGRSHEHWTFHPIPFDSMADPDKIHLLFAQMFADDFDGDGDNDVIGGSAHAYGLWWFEQIRRGTEIDFVPHQITMDLSQLHAMNAVDLDGDGDKEYVTGKRYLAHLGRDPGAFDPPFVALITRSEDPSVALETHLIDEDSGSGTQIWVADLNRDLKPDVLTSNKKGTFVFLQR